MAFPSGPANGAITTINGVTYTYSSAKNQWYVSTSGVVPSSVSGNLTVTGNVLAASLVNGTSNVSLVSSGNVTVSVNGTTNVAVFATTGMTTGNIIATGNANVTGTITSTGNANIGGNLNLTGSFNPGTITTSANVTAGNLVTGGNLSFTGTSNRITGDMTNATIANRVFFQTSTTNGGTFVSAIPNGSGLQAGFVAYAQSDPANASTLSILPQSAASQWSIRAGIQGTGTYLPLTFYTGGVETLRIDTNGNVGVGTSTPVNSFNIAKQSSVLAGSSNSYGMYIYPTSSGACYIDAITSSSSTTDLALRTYNGGTYNAPIQTSSGGTITTFQIGGVERVRIDASGRFSVRGGSYQDINALGTVSTTQTLDFSTYNNWSMTLSGSITLANPTNLTAGQSGVIFITQDATGSRTVSFGSYWRFPGNVAPTLSSSASSVDAIVYTARTTTSITAQILYSIG